MPQPTRNAKSWVGVAFGVAGRFGRRMRDEWNAGKAEAGQPLEAGVYRKSAPMLRRVPISERWWEVLQIAPSASENEIRQAWRRLMKKNHPDKGGQLPAETRAAMEQMARRLNDAYGQAMTGRVDK